MKALHVIWYHYASTHVSLFIRAVTAWSVSISQVETLILLLLWLNNRCQSSLPVPLVDLAFNDLLISPNSRIVSPTHGGTVHLGLEPMTSMLLSCTSWRLYYETGLRKINWSKNYTICWIVFPLTFVMFCLYFKEDPIRSTLRFKHGIKHGIKHGCSTRPLHKCNLTIFLTYTIRFIRNWTNSRYVLASIPRFVVHSSSGFRASTYRTRFW